MHGLLIWFGVILCCYLFLTVRRLSEKELPKRKEKPKPLPEVPVPTRTEIAQDYSRQYEEELRIIDELDLDDYAKADGKEEAKARLIRRIEGLL